MSLINLVYAQQQQHDYILDSTMETSQDSEEFYTHKKFNSNAYRHKKFGNSFMRSRSVESLHGEDSSSGSFKDTQKLLANNEILAEVEDESQNSTSSVSSIKPSTIFRPYALGENTPRKRRTHQRHEQPQKQQQQQQQLSSMSAEQLQRMRMMYTSEGGNLHQLHQQPLMQHNLLHSQQSSQSQVSLLQNHQQQQQHFLSTTASILPPHSLLPQQPRPPQFTMNHRTLAIMLQKQREALYMRQVLQLKGAGHHLPTSRARC